MTHTARSARGSNRDNDRLADSVREDDELTVALGAETWFGRDQDGVAALHDVEAEAGDEAEISDLFDLDRREARALGANLDSAGGQEAVLD